VRDILRLLFVSALVTLLVQTVRIVDRGWFGKTPSVLVGDDEESAARVDDSALSLADLARNYEAARSAVAAYEREMGPVVQERDRDETEPYASMNRWKEAIEERERSLAKVREMRYYCLLGALLIVGGSI